MVKTSSRLYPSPRPAIMFAVLICAICGCNESGPKQSDPSRLEKIVAPKLKNGASESVVKEFNDYLASYPNDALAWTILGHTHSELDQDEEALKCYDRAIEIEPEQFQAITGKGILYRKLGEYDKAMSAYQRAIEIEPDYAEAYSSMAVIAVKQNQDQKAVEYGLKSYSLDKKNPVVAANLCLAYHYAGDIPNRDKFYEIARSLNYENLDSLEQIFSGELTVKD